jgi:type II secretory pathway pseudopilin PulG
MTSGIQNLEQFVRAALEKGSQKSAIEQCLREAGWPADQIRNALDQFADIAFPVPVPKPRPYLSAREAFRYLLLFTTLYFSAYYLGSLLFNFVDLKFPDPAMRDYWRSTEDNIRWAAAFLVVAFPIFLFMSRRIYGEMARDPAKRLSVIRRWLTYLTLFITAGFVIGDLVTLVYNALGGELTVRFTLKVLIVGVIAGTVFGFYLWDLLDEERSTNRSAAMKLLAAAVSAVVVASLVGSVFVLGSPAEQRQRRLDEHRLQDLQSIARSIQSYAKSNNNTLPPDLQALEKETGLGRVPTDSDTRMPYEYKTLDAQSYHLCAVFSRPSSDDDRASRYAYEWHRSHAAGKQCFKYTLDNNDSGRR